MSRSGIPETLRRLRKQRREHISLRARVKRAMRKYPSSEVFRGALKNLDRDIDHETRLIERGKKFEGEK